MLDEVDELQIDDLDELVEMLILIFEVIEIEITLMHQSLVVEPDEPDDESLEIVEQI